MVDENAIMIFETMLERGSSIERFWQLNIKKPLLSMIELLESEQQRKDFCNTVILENVELVRVNSDLQVELDLLRRAYESEIKLIGGEK